MSTSFCKPIVYRLLLEKNAVYFNYMSTISYTSIDLLCFIILSILLIRQVYTHKKDDASRQFLNLLVVSLCFIANDAIWGLLSSPTINSSVFWLSFFSFTFHWLSGFASFIWFRYAKLYTISKREIQKKTFIFWLIPLFVLSAILIINCIKPVIFEVVLEDSIAIYKTQEGRLILFILEGFYFVLGLIDTAIHSIKEKDSIKQRRYITVIIFALIPIFSSVIQYLLPFAPAYSVGFMFCCLVIFTFNTTAENEIFSVMLHEAQNLEKISSYEKQLQNAFENEVYHEILQKQGAGVIAVNMDSEIVFINDAAAKMYGYPNATNFSDTTEDLIAKSESACAEAILHKLKEMKKAGGQLSFEVTTRMNEHKIKNILVEAHVVDIFGGNKLAIFCLADITNNKLLEKELLHLSETDPLTGLSNRRSGEQRTELLLLSNKSGMFCILDADRFKTINDTYGHSVGDKVLVAIAQCLKKAFRGLDIIMRMGGDEFSVFAVNIDTKEKAKICLDRLVEEIRKCEIPELQGNHFSVSIGAVLCIPESGKTIDDYFKMADEALYISKEVRENHYEFSDYDIESLDIDNGSDTATEVEELKSE